MTKIIVGWEVGEPAYIEYCLIHPPSYKVIIKELVSMYDAHVLSSKEYSELSGVAQTMYDDGIIDYDDDWEG